MNEKRLNDNSLMRAIAQGDEDALTILYDRYSKLVYTIALRIINNHESAEEITLDIFKQLWSKSSYYDSNKGTVQAWLHRMTRNRAIDRYRKEKHFSQDSRLNWADGLFEQQGSSHLELSLQQKEQQSRIREAVQSLTEPQRQSLVLAFFFGMSHREIANHLDVPLGTIKGRIRSGMQALRGKLVL